MRFAIFQDFKLVWVTCLLLIPFGVQGGTVYDVERILDGQDGLAKQSSASLAQSIASIAARTQPGDALRLSAKYAVSKLDLSAVADDVEISGFGADTLVLHGGHDNMVIWGTGALLDVGSGALAKTSGTSGSSYGLTNSFVYDASALEGSFSNSKFLVTDNYSNRRMFVLDRQNPGGSMSKIDGFDNCVILYINIHSYEGKTDPLLGIKNGDNSTIAHMVQANYGSLAAPAEVYIQDSKNINLLIGDSEGSATTTFFFANNQNLLWAGHRVFSSHNREPFGNSVRVVGGTGTRFVQSQDIGDPKELSVEVLNSNDLQIWGGAWENPTQVPADALRLFDSPDCFNGQLANKWAEPIYTGNEIPFRHEGKDLTNASIAASVTVPPPPAIPVVGMNGAMPKLRYTQDAQFGSALLAAGADPSGKHSSSAAFRKVMATTGKLEIPPGTYLLTETLELGAVTKSLAKTSGLQEGAGIQAVGAGQALTRLVAAHDRMSVVHVGSNASISNVTLVGGMYGLDLTNVYHAGKNFTNLVIEAPTLAGIKVGSSEWGKGIPRFEGGANACAKAHEFDQNRFLNIVVDGKGKTQYGFHSNMYMMDKNLYYKCTFKNLTKAGWSANFSNIECFSFVQCRFENIDGPGIDLWPICGTCPEFSCTGSNKAHGKGYTPAMVMINESEFINCGNATRPVIDYNWTESSIIANTTIRIDDGREWKYGFLGTAGAMSNVTIDVDRSKMVPGGAAIALRQAYQAKNSRTNGNILRDVTANAPIKFLNDSKGSYIDGIQTDIAMENYFTIGNTWKLWSSFGETEWSYPNLIYNSTFMDENGAQVDYDYILIGTDRDGAVKKQVVYEGQPVGLGGPIGQPSLQATSPGGFSLFDVSGKKVGHVEGLNPASLSAHGLNPGTYFAKPQQGGLMRRVAVY